jgi:5-formaminoimidazole-4-carboxamide-1-beta-D-ribofuranosyl 5'-monophosphate synthetase
MEDGLYSTAYKFLFKSRVEEGIVNCLIKVVPEGNKGERDLFIARAVLDMLSREDNTDKARYIKREAMAGLKLEQTAILNYIDLVFECIEIEDFDIFIEATNVDYRPEINRDGTLHAMCNSIAKRHFGQPIV